VKRIAAFILLGILLFNWVGYRFLSSWLENKANQQFAIALDNNQYEESDLISIKVPNNLPYTNSKDFQRVDGQVEISGIIYNYVKMRVSHDFVELLCIPNQHVTKMQAARDVFFKMVNDLQGDNQGKKSDSHPSPNKNFSFDYYTVGDLFNLNFSGSARGQVSSDFSFNIPTCFSLTAEQPPERC
ncbi:MAG: hypothetical protein ACHQEM_13090, partial [Chitinophagales bacterium]